MSFEVEVKYRSVNHDDLRRRLAERQAEAVGTIELEDVYLRHPSRDFARTDEALRIRRIDGENRITYKGPKRPGPTKTREEIEVAFDGGESSFGDLSRLFDSIGFRRVAAVRKSRTTFRVSLPPFRVEVTLDRAEGLGDFAEVEAIAPDEAALPSAQAAVLILAAELGLAPDQVEPRSYLRMTLEARQDG